MKKILSVLIFTCLLFSGFAADIEEKLSHKALKAEAFFERGNDRYDAGNYQEAIKDFNKAIEIDAKFVAKFMPRLRSKAYNLRGNAKFKSGKYKEAIKDYNESIKLDPECVWVYFNRARVYAKMGYDEKAIKDYTKILQLMPSEDFAYYMRGNIEAEAGHYKKAIKDYNKAIKSDPYYFEAYCKRGDAELHLKQYKKAILTYKKAITLTDKNAQAYNGIKKVREQIAYDATARTRFLLKQDNIKLISDKVAPYFNSGIPTKKVLVIKKIRKAHDKNNYASLYYSKGKQKFKPKKRTKKEKCKKLIDKYIKSLEIAYEKAEKYNQSGNIYFKDGKYKEAIADYNQAVKSAPRMIAGYHKRGNAFFESGKFKEARKDFMKAREIAESWQKTKVLESIEKDLKQLDKVEASLKK